MDGGVEGATVVMYGLKKGEKGNIAVCMGMVY